MKSYIKIKRCSNKEHRKGIMKQINNRKAIEKLTHVHMGALTLYGPNFFFSSFLGT